MSRIPSTSILRSSCAIRSVVPARRLPSAISNGPSSSTLPIGYSRRWNSTTTTSSEPPKRSATDSTGTNTNGEQSSGDTPTEKGEAKGGLKVSWIFSGLAGLGALVTIYGLLEFYSTLKTWPKEVRIPLRAALKSKLRQDYMKSEKYFREALEVALALGPKALEPEPLQKITGIYVELATVLELMGQRVTAFQELRNAVEMFGQNPLRQPNDTPINLAGNNSSSSSSGNSRWIGNDYILNHKDHIRVIGLYQKLGQLSLEISSSKKAPSFKPSSTSSNDIGQAPSPKIENWNDAAEFYLSEALTSLLKLGLTNPPSTSNNNQTQQQVVLGRDVNLPQGEISEDAEQGGSVDKRGLGMTMESLSEVYARKGQYNLSAQLLLQAVSLLLPPGGQDTPPVRDRCQAAMIMTTISSHALRQSAPGVDSAKSIKISKSWSLRSLQLSEEALHESEGENYKDSPLEAAIAVCSRAKGVGLYNLGMLAEMEGDLPTALNYFQKSSTASREIGFSEGKREAAAAIRRIQALGGTSTS
ncbi:uncharacterized protein IL334_002474 [Kwoniella shivajii]|uniref:TPR repeat-containing protein n=1 Tax=Kwoniella shivajii TaxID=564305 RepID=A0ABZ1CUU8_9TREE|nr:hypothetical protein IL334_002474 [Kwoniella shivajii]